jgi:hypothetical protein
MIRARAFLTICYPGSRPSEQLYVPEDHRDPTEPAYQLQAEGIRVPRP